MVRYELPRFYQGRLWTSPCLETASREEAMYLDKWLACSAGKDSSEALHALYLRSMRWGN